MIVNYSTSVFPRKEIVATCAECGVELARLAWSNYADHSRQKSKLIKELSSCPKCKAGQPRKAVLWEKQRNGDLLAKAKDGDFLIWKHGFGYKWRYRRYGNVYADRMGFAKSKEDAKRVCEADALWQSE